MAGQALQRLLLTATDHGLATSMLSQPIEVPAAREQLRIGLGRGGTPQMVVRIGYGRPGQPTDRRPLDEVIDHRSRAEGDFGRVRDRTLARSSRAVQAED